MPRRAGFADALIDIQGGCTATIHEFSAQWREIVD